jgi:hypothetical protein
VVVGNQSANFALCARLLENQAKTDGMKRVFSGLAFIAFNRRRAIGVCASLVALSGLAEWYWNIPSMFSCSGAILTVAGLLLSVKRSMHFHLNLSKESFHHILSGAGPFGRQMTAEDEKRVDDWLADERCAVALIVIGTMIWAYGGYAMGLIRTYTAT